MLWGLLAAVVHTCLDLTCLRSRRHPDDTTDEDDGITVLAVEMTVEIVSSNDSVNSRSDVVAGTMTADDGKASHVEMSAGCAVAGMGGSRAFVRSQCLLQGMLPTVTTTFEPKLRPLRKSIEEIKDKLQAKEDD